MRSAAALHPTTIGARLDGNGRLGVGGHFAAGKFSGTQLCKLSRAAPDRPAVMTGLTGDPAFAPPQA